MQEEKTQCFGKERSVKTDGAVLNFSLNSGDDAPMINVRINAVLYFCLLTRRKARIKIENETMSALKKQRIDLRLTEDDKNMIEEAAAMTNQSISQFMVSTASERAAEVIDQHRRLVLSEASWNTVMDAISNPPAPNDRLKQAAKRLRDME